MRADPVHFAHRFQALSVSVGVRLASSVVAVMARTQAAV